MQLLNMLRPSIHDSPTRHELNVFLSYLPLPPSRFVSSICPFLVQFEPTELSSVLLAAKVSSAVILATTARGQIAANIIVLLTVPGFKEVPAPFITL